MADNLVIVESPAKAKTISKFLGKDYRVRASMGHVRDLPKSKFGIDVEKDFKPTYVVSSDKKKVISQLKSYIKKGTRVYIATDEDREGEAIGWHLLKALGVDEKKQDVKRIVFHEITESAIKHAIESPRQIDKDLVDAQQARRILDRIVGYELSPLLWKKVRYGLSAGRVQSVAVRLIVERERQILDFVPEEYWSLTADLLKAKDGFTAELKKFEGKDFKIGNEKESNAVLKAIDGADWKVMKVEKKDVTRKPAPPFITSTLQQEASRKLGFSVKRTMMIAQQLYEGIKHGKGETGLITYMRTDSVNLAAQALHQAQDVITEEFGKEYALPKPRLFKGKKGAQEAHEAIRPVDLSIKPEDVKSYLDKDQYRLYELIWKRTLACQMAEAKLKAVGVDIAPIKNGKDTGYNFRATGQTVEFPGFMRVYTEDFDDEEEAFSFAEKLLPVLEEGDDLKLKQLNPNQHFTKPPARYTEASLVKKLESEGIGRPSTYAPTIGTIMARGYIEKEGKQLRPTDLAFMVTDILVKHFSDIVNYKFTAELEESLDDIADGKKKWVPVIEDFYTPFHKVVTTKEKSIKKDDVMKERNLGKDKKSGLDVVVRHGRFGPFVQLGDYTKEEVDAMEEKPKRASLPKGTYFETITIEEALKALELPRNLGKTKKGEEVIALIGRFGPYLKVDKLNVTLPKDFDPYTVTLKDVENLIEETRTAKKKAAEPIQDFGKPDPVSGENVLVKTGFYGPYVTDGKTNASIGKKFDPEKITFEEACDLLEKKRHAPKRNFRRGKKKAAEK